MPISQIMTNENPLVDLVIVPIFLNEDGNYDSKTSSFCKNIKDFTGISKLERLVILNVGYTNISFFEKNKKNILIC